ncbi:MAG: YkoF family thiamine/hydroxymethylpyrimidine-binding protein [Bacteroidales bacterium]
MKASVEISMYPLGREYVPEIKEFIDRVKQHPGITAEVNGMSTQLFGDFHEIMQMLTDEMSLSFMKEGKSVFVMKVVNAFLQQ